jgi:hypothetical protein
MERRRFGVEEVDVVTSPSTSEEEAKRLVDGQPRRGSVTTDCTSNEHLDWALLFLAAEDDGIQYAHGKKCSNEEVKNKLGGIWAIPPPPPYLAEPLGLNPVRCVR